MLQKEIKWKQWSRNKWLEAGDYNTKFFHATANARSRVKWINSIFARDKLWKNKEDNERKVVFFFQQLYKGDNHRRPRMDGILFLLGFKCFSFLSWTRLTKEERLEKLFLGLVGIVTQVLIGFLLPSFKSFGIWLKLMFEFFFNEFHDNGVIVGNWVLPLLLWFLKKMLLLPLRILGT